MCSRLKMYAGSLSAAADDYYVPPVIKKNSAWSAQLETDVCACKGQVGYIVHLKTLELHSTNQDYNTTIADNICIYKIM